MRPRTSFTPLKRREKNCSALVAEGILAHVGAGGLDIQDALMLVNISLGRFPGDAGAACGHTQDGTHRSGRAGIYAAAFSEGTGEGFHHGAGDFFVLLPSEGREVPDLILGLLPEGIQFLVELLAVRGQIARLGAGAKHLKGKGIGFSCIGIP